MASSTPGPGRASAAPSKRTSETATSWWSLTKYSWNPTSSPPTRRMPGTQWIVGDGKQPDPHSEAVGQLGGDAPEGGALGEALGPIEVGGQVLVAEVEPGDAPEPAQGLHHPPGLTRQAPPRLRIDGVGERVHDGVQVGGDVEPMEIGVVPDVDDGRDLARRHHLDQPPEQPGRAHPSGQGGDHLAFGASGARRGHPRRLPAGRHHLSTVHRPARRSGRAPGMCKAHPVPPERPATTDEGRLSVGFDATPLLGRPTGVGAFCTGALAGLGDRARRGRHAFAVSWRRRRGIEARLPPGIASGQRPMPARPLHAAWAHRSLPPVEWFVGRHDVVHGSNFVVPPTRWAARVVTVHDLTVVRFPELCDAPTLAYPALIRRAVAEGAWVHTPSSFVAGEVVEEFGIDADRVRAVHHGIPELPEPTGRRAAGTPAGPGAPRRVPPLCARRGHRRTAARTIRCWSARSARWRPPTPMSPSSIVGGDGWGAESFADAVASSPVTSRIVRPGYLDDAALADVLGGASVLAYPSRYEGFGFPPLQAMAAGVPVVATAAGAVPEVVGDGAWLVDPGDGDELSARIVALLDGGTAADQLVARGRSASGLSAGARAPAGLAALYRDAAGTSGRARQGRGRRGPTGEPSARPAPGRAAPTVGGRGHRHVRAGPTPGARRRGRRGPRRVRPSWS